MPLINTSVPNLIQGVSQQPDATRFAGQCEEQENALSSVAEGLKKRPNTRHVARLLDTAIAEDSFVHFIDRDDNEKYVVILDKTTDKLFAYNIVSGAEASIDGGTGGVSIGSDHYLYSANPREDLKGLTVADNTFLLNTTKETEETTLLAPALIKQALVSINQGDYQKQYRIHAGKSAYAYFGTISTSTYGNYIRINSVIVTYGGYDIDYVEWTINGKTVTNVVTNTRYRRSLSVVLSLTTHA